MTVVAVDSHAHIIDRAYPLWNDRTYDPDDSQYGSAGRFLSILDSHGLSHGLVVAAEPYGSNNSVMLDAIAASGGRLLGVAIVDPDIGENELASLAAGGVVGVRYNLTSFGMRQFLHPATKRLFALLREMGLFLQIHTQHDELVKAMDILGRHDIMVVIDHFGRPEVTRGLDQPGFAAMLELGRRGNSAVKLSGPFRCSRLLPPYQDVDPFIEAAIDAFGIDNCVWGSDWPFVRTLERYDYGPEHDCLKRWLPDEADRNKVLAGNPVRIFGFN